METIIENLINGNLAEAKQQARKWKAWVIRDALTDGAGMSLAKATLCADWLKGRDCWQEYCDAK